MQSLSELIKFRRTVKPIVAIGESNFSERPVSKETIEQLLSNANWAPTHGLTEPWRFTVYQGDSLKDLAEFLRQAYTAHTSEEDFKEAKREKMASYAECTQVAVVLGMKRHPGKIPAEEEVMAVACAVQNLHLSAAAEGLGGFWSTAPVYDVPTVRTEFGFDGEEDRCLGIFYLGYPGNEWPERKKGAPQPVEEKIIWR
ncbi:MAG: nitroreductase [Planctomycetaceae bacterium]|nr:nitroreductase [Planctomycetaceae bacterium]